MENIWIELFSLPSFVVYGIFGGVGGAIGVLVGKGLGKLFNIKWLTRLSQILCVVIAIQIPKLIIPEFKKEVALASVLKEFKSIRLYQVIFRQHPEAELEFRSKIAAALGNSTADSVFAATRDSTNQLVTKYFDQYVLSASDDSIFSLLKSDADSMLKFNSNPELCVSYFLGKPKFGNAELNKEFIQLKSDLKADVIESSINNPSPLSNPGTAEDLGKTLATSYLANGFDAAEMAKVDQVQTLPVDQGCKIATDFSVAIASLAPQRSAYVFKSLILLSK